MNRIFILIILVMIPLLGESQARMNLGVVGSGTPAGAAPPEIAYVTGAKGSGTGSLSTVAAAAFAATTGNLIVVFVTNVATGGTVHVDSIADTAGNTYTYILRRYYSSAGAIEVWYAKNITGHAANIVTATFSGADTYRAIQVHQYSGCDTAAPYDVSNYGEGGGGSPTSLSTTAATTNAENEVIAAGYRILATGAWTAGANFTMRQSENYYGSEDRIVTSTGSYGSAASNAGNAAWVGVHATFKRGS